MTTPAHIFKTARRQIRKIRHRGASTDKERLLLASADRQRECGLGWRYDGFGGMATGDILGKLSEFGVSLDEASFKAAALEAGSPTKLGEAWTAASTAEGRWADYPHMAARELWGRLLAEEVRAEVVSDQVDALLELAEVEDDPDRRLELWREASDILTGACLKDGVPDHAMFQGVMKETGTDLTGWMNELPPRLMGTKLESLAAGLCLAFSHFADGPSLLAERAEILLRLGDAEAAVSEIDALLKKHPREASVLLKAGGIYEQVGRGEDAQTCLKAYTDALDRRRMAAQAKIESMRQRAPVEPGLFNPVSLKDVMLKAAPNEPCPCGSGKKFKRCHGMGK